MLMVVVVVVALDLLFFSLLCDSLFFSPIEFLNPVMFLFIYLFIYLFICVYLTSGILTYLSRVLKYNDVVLMDSS